MNWFQEFLSIYDNIRPILDVLLLAFLLFKGYEFLEKTQAFQLVKGAGFLALIYGIAFVLNLSTLKWVLTIIAPMLLIAVAIVFQPELRKIILRLGQREFFRSDTSPGIGRLEMIVTAAEMLSRERRGMLVVFPRKTNIKSIIDTGTKINAEISSSLIVAIFKFDGPLHDGAMVIHNGKIAAAECLLPLSEQQDIQKNFGTRHRAALGMTEHSDAIILVVSEETGAISLAYDGKLYYDVSIADVTRKLKDLLDRESRREAEHIEKTVEENIDSKEVIIE